MVDWISLYNGINIYFWSMRIIFLILYVFNVKRMIIFGY